MRQLIGFRIRRRVRRVSRWILGKTRIRRFGYNRLHPTRPTRTRKMTLPITKLKNWSQRLTQRFSLLGSTRGSECKPGPVPRGHLAVYVGQKEGDVRRDLVPIVYFNHPLFGELLRESEKEYGFRHEGGITIPCLYSDFQRVKTRIASGLDSRIFPWSRLCSS
ncbi:unnamed protein product [Eruca vesicaria subsp. sativa]|uniref:Uncharacterized protein n=1 Tax=Eruca vesicaria subsp. sativa TaxID=29727 RepID=A0ABC8LJI0_ERUVS|nr:unnamed protein product [Eruca vesicaria subsp. sativa]